MYITFLLITITSNSHSSHGMLPRKRGDVFRWRGYSSHFYAVYPRNLAVSETIYTFAGENRVTRRRLSNSCVPLVASDQRSSASKLDCIRLA